MSRYTGPSYKKARRVGFSISETGKELARRPYRPGQHGNDRRGKESDYGTQLKEKQKGKNRDITSYERKLFNERVKGLKQEISNLENEVSDLEDSKESINKQITKLSKDKDDIKDQIYKKRNINDKIILKSKNQLLNENQKLSKQNEDLKHENYQLKYKNEELEQQKNYLLYYI